MLKGSSGVYRSDGLVVIERHRHQFPALCATCGAACAAPQPAHAAPGTRPAPQPPLCPACGSRRGRVVKIIAITGIVMILAAPAVFHPLGHLPAIALLLTGITDLGIAWWMRGRVPGFRTVREDEQYVWIAGAQRDFLAALPAWHGMKLDELQRREG